MCRKLALAATALGLVLAVPALAGAKDKTPPAPAAAATPAPAAPSPPAPPPRKATAEERAAAERLDPLARAAFWAREVDLDGRDAAAGVHLAAAMRAMDRNQEAAETAQRVLVLEPDNRDALFELARADLAGGQGFYAIDPLKRLQVQAASDWRVFSLLGVAYEQVSRGDDAETAWRQALTLSPDNPSVLNNLAMHYAAKGDSAQAETLLRRAAVQPGATIQVRQNLALVLGLGGKLAEAEQLERQDLPPDMAENNLAYLRAASSGGGAGRTWRSVQGAQAAAAPTPGG